MAGAGEQPVQGAGEPMQLGSAAPTGAVEEASRAAFAEGTEASRRGSRPTSSDDARGDERSGDSDDARGSSSSGGSVSDGRGSGGSRRRYGTSRPTRADLAPAIAKAEERLRSSQYQEAVADFTRLLAGAPAGAGRARLLLGRSAAYAGFAGQLRAMPASQSESRAIYAPDPFQLARLALSDAQAAEAESPGGPEAAAREGDAHVLLEQYREARRAYRRAAERDRERSTATASCAGAASQQASGAAVPEGEGAALWPGGQGLRAYLDARMEACSAALQGAMIGLLGDEGEREGVVQDVECTLCMRLLWEPVTTPCGHTFCKPCLARAADHSNRCPMCRVVLHMGPQPAVTVVLRALLQRGFQTEYAARTAEEAAAAAPAGAEGSAAPLPLFVMSPMLPGEHMALNIFEPRYRLMVRRCMEGSRRFGMAVVDRAHRLHEVACEAEITECSALPDGRFYLEIVGRRRFQPMDDAEQDGYRTARPQYLADDPVPPGSDEEAALRALCSSTEAAAGELLGRLGALSGRRRGVAELLSRLGACPGGGGPEALSFWASNVVCSILDDPLLKMRLLSTRSTQGRLEEVLGLLRQLGTAGAAGQAQAGCSIM